MLPVRPVVVKPGSPGSFQAGLAVLTDLRTAAAVFVVRGHISHAGVQPHGIPMHLKMIKLGAQHGGFGDLQQVRELGLEMPEERLDPGMVGRAWPWWVSAAASLNARPRRLSVPMFGTWLADWPGQGRR